MIGYIVEKKIIGNSHTQEKKLIDYNFLLINLIFLILDLINLILLILESIIYTITIIFGFSGLEPREYI